MEMTSRKIQAYQNKAKNLFTIFVLDLDGECKCIKKIIVIKEICSSLPPWSDE